MSRFPGLCLVDTFELAEPRDTEFEFMTAANTERVNAQKKAPIRVILGNPPYNANQQDENDNNKNRKYPYLDRRIRNTFAADSNATLLNKLSDPYIKSLRWASDRIGDEGIVAYVTNSGYVDGIATDGVRKHLAQDFDAIYIVDLGGNVRKNPKLSGTTHNVFGIQVGVCIALFVRHRQKQLKPRKAVIHYADVGDDWRKEKKWKWLEDKGSIDGVKWRTLKPDARNTWLHDEEAAGFTKFLPVGSKETKAIDSLDAQAIFRTYSLGVSTNRDSVVYDFDSARLAKRVEEFADDYNAEVARWQRKKPSADELDAFLKTDRIKWSRNLKSELKRGKCIDFDKANIRDALYRPFTKRALYLDDIVVDEPAHSRVFSPSSVKSAPAITVSDIGHRASFSAMMVAGIYDLHLCASSDAFQCFPLYTYDTEGGSRRDNVTDWALVQFQYRYPKLNVTKKAIFHYVYAVLHHPAYREKYAANLRRELPRIPFAADFAAFAKAGEKLATLHTGYESQKEFKLKRIETPGAKLDLRVERMKLAKDKASLVYNDYLTLVGIPAAAHEYRLGNRSALEWVIDQYRLERDEQGEITSDPNREDDEEYILRLVGQVVTVSVETVKLVNTLPPLEPPAKGYTQAEADAAHVYTVNEDQSGDSAHLEQPKAL